MKHLILPAALALAFAGSVAFAQQPAASPDSQQSPAPIERHHAPNPHRETAGLTRQLSLTPDQSAKIEPILADREQKVAALRSDTSLTDDARRQQMRAIQKQSREQLDAVLTPAQQEQMKSIRHNRGPHGAPGEGQPSTPPPAA